MGDQLRFRTERRVRGGQRGLGGSRRRAAGRESVDRPGTGSGDRPACPGLGPCEVAEDEDARAAVAGSGVPAIDTAAAGPGVRRAAGRGRR